MSDHTFRVIRTAKVGTLDPEMKQEWDRLYEESVRLREEQEEFEMAMDAFSEALQDAYPGSEEPHGTRTVLRVHDDGDVYAEYCTCPACQAKLQGLSVAETVEKMYQSSLISDESLSDARKKAKSIDARTKQKEMLN